MSGKKIGWALLAFLLAFSAAFLMLKGSGFFPEPNILDVLSLMVLIITLSASKKTFYFLLLPISIGYALYTPVGITFGAPTYQYIASIFATERVSHADLVVELCECSCDFTSGHFLSKNYK